MNKLTPRQQDKLTAAAQDAILFAVVGSGEFPLDMLRYDKCWPASEGDSGRLAWKGSTRRIEMRGLKRPTVGRWHSFGWKAIEDVR